VERLLECEDAALGARALDLVEWLCERGDTFASFDDLLLAARQLAAGGAFARAVSQDPLLLRLFLRDGASGPPPLLPAAAVASLSAEDSARLVAAAGEGDSGVSTALFHLRALHRRGDAFDSVDELAMAVAQAHAAYQQRKQGLLGYLGRPESKVLDVAASGGGGDAKSAVSL
jgi:hypothetical protein